MPTAPALPDSSLAGPRRPGRRGWLCALALALALALARGLAATPFLVADVNPQPIGGPSAGGPTVGELLGAGRQAFFVTQVPRSDPETSEGSYELGLWRTDGTVGGARLVRVFLVPAYSAGSLQLLETLGSRVLFLGVEGTQTLWVSDGTPQGTVPLTPPDLLVPDVRSGVYRAAAVGGRWIFPGCEQVPFFVCRPWVTDGTPAGTRPLLQSAHPEATSVGSGFATLAGRLHFLSAGRLYQTDGTTLGTRLVANLGAANAAHGLVATSDRLFFLRGTRSSELWTSDGTRAGTQLVRRFPHHVHQGVRYPSVLELVPATSRVYFGIFDVSVGRVAVATSDGSRAGTLAVTPEWEVDPSQGIAFRVVAVLGDRLLMTRADGTLWSSDGTPRSTRAVRGCAGGCPLLPWGAGVVVGGEAIFTGRRADSGLEPWRSDGSGAGTRQLADLCGGPCDGSSGFFLPLGRRVLTNRWLQGEVELWSLPLEDGEAAERLHLGGILGSARLGRRLLLTVSDTVLSAPVSFLLTDGTPGGTTSLEAPLAASAGSQPTELVAFAGGIAFAACDGEGMGPFHSDGTASGTHRLGPGVTFCGFGVRDMKVWQGALYYLAAGRLYRSEGTAEDAVELVDTGTGGYETAYLRALADRLVLISTPSNAPARAWVSDGTLEGTVPFELGELLWVCNPTVLGGRLYFAAEAHDAELDRTISGVWRTDGTAEGTTLLVGQVFGPVCGAEIVPLGERVYFLAWGSLWSSDGTPAGTQALVAEGQLPFYDARYLVAFGGRLFFLANPAADFGPDRFLYRSNGTALGTVPLAPVGTQDYGETSPELTAVGERLFFRATDAAHGDELWVSDGTTTGTRLVLDLVPGPGSSRPRGLTAAAGALYFAADDGTHGIEPWRSDGTAAGTVPLGDLAPVGFSSWPGSFTASGARVYFAADDGEHGSELWAVEVTP